MGFLGRKKVMINSASRILAILMLFFLASCTSGEDHVETYDDPAAIKAEKAVLSLQSEVESYLSVLDSLAKKEALGPPTSYGDMSRFDSFAFYRDSLKDASNSLTMAASLLKLERGQAKLVKSVPVETRRQTIGFAGRMTRDLNNNLRLLHERQSYVAGRGILADHYYKTIVLLERVKAVLDEVSQLSPL